MKQTALDLDGICAGPLFGPINKVRPPVRPLGKAGVIHRAQTRRATPPWSDMKLVAVLYRLAKKKTQATGELYVVDHIVPKISPWVCGLHVPRNLRVIHWRENTLKANAWWPEMWMQQTDIFEQKEAL